MITFLKSIIGTVAVVIIAVIYLSAGIAKAQHFANMTDEIKIELALDWIRKGVQQEDTTKVFMPFAQQIDVKGKGLEQKENLIPRLQNIFDNSSSRKLALNKPVFSRSDNPLMHSNFWDFDILEPHITITGDTAYVDCELVLWGSLEEGNNELGSSRVSERFVFVSPPKVEPAVMPENTEKWPESKQNKSSINNSGRGWVLIGYEQLMGFLGNQVETLSVPEKELQGEGK